MRSLMLLIAALVLGLSPETGAAKTAVSVTTTCSVSSAVLVTLGAGQTFALTDVVISNATDNLQEVIFTSGAVLAGIRLVIIAPVNSTSAQTFSSPVGFRQSDANDVNVTCIPGLLPGGGFPNLVWVTVTGSVQ